MLKKKFPREMGSQRMIMKDRVPSELISWASSWSAGLSKLKFTSIAHRQNCHVTVTRSLL